MTIRPFFKACSRSWRCVSGLATVLLILLCFLPNVGAAEMMEGAASPTGDGGQEASLAGPGDVAPDVSFPTFKESGLEICTGDDGKPVILLFSSASCSHCQWSGEIFDFMVMYYVANGLITAHHYDVNTGDDLLTEEVETEIPMAHLDLKAHGDPKGLVPYFNFGCKYERIGNGYEKSDDTVSEAAEMRQVIEVLVKMVSEGNYTHGAETKKDTNEESQ